jgi:hypothetical protein
MELTREGVVDYVQEYCRTRKTGPSARQILKHFDQTTPAKLYELFPEGKAEIYAAAGIPLSDRDRRMMRQTEKASLKKQLIIEKRRKAAGEVEKPSGGEVKPELVSPEEASVREAEEEAREATMRLEAERRRREAEKERTKAEAILDAKKIPAYLQLVERVSPTAKAFLELCKQEGKDPGNVCGGLVKERCTFDEWGKLTKRNEDFDVYLEDLLSDWVHSCRIELAKRKHGEKSYSLQCGLCGQRLEYNPEGLEFEQMTYLPNSRLHCPSCEPDGSRWHWYSCPICKEVDGCEQPMEYIPSLNVLECHVCGYTGEVKGTPLKPLGTFRKLRDLKESRLKNGMEKLRVELKELKGKVEGKSKELSRLNDLVDVKRSRVQELEREIDMLEARRSNLDAAVKAEERRLLLEARSRVDRTIAEYSHARLQEFNAGWTVKLEKVKADVEAAEKERDRLLDEVAGLRGEVTGFREELKELHARVGPGGAVTDLVQRIDALKEELAETKRELEEKALWLSGAFSARLEAETWLKGMVEHLFDQAGGAGLLFTFLADPKAVPREHFNELSRLLDELEVWRSYEEPPAVYKNLPLRSRENLERIVADVQGYLKGS